ncbi:MAG: hypothetical protein K0Q49_110 [Haloplasmataceae bacterium]|jgi:PDZ domain-containing protein|nr:hypothetical protein [Haloplasmataceae bacterium]
MIQSLKKLTLKQIIIFAISYVLLLMFFVYPTPYEVLLPGGVEEANRIITIEDSNPQSGAFYSSYVSVITKPSTFQFVLAKFNRGADIEKLSKSVSQLSVDEINKSSEIDKLYSIHTSIIVAYREAGKDLTYDESGVIISYRAPMFDAFDDFRIGDLITAVNGETIKNKAEFQLKTVNIGCNIDINFTILRNNKIMDITTNKTIYESNCKLGLNLYSYYTNFVGNPKFDWGDTEGYGSSAGLMQTLSIYNALIDEDLTHGLQIAGTGVIDINGAVLPIAGIKQKVFGAIKNDMDIYIAPNIEDSSGNNLYMLALEAKRIKNSDIEIVPVKTFAEAVKFLKEYKK